MTDSDWLELRAVLRQYRLPLRDLEQLLLSRREEAQAGLDTPITDSDMLEFVFRRAPRFYRSETRWFVDVTWNNVLWSSYQGNSYREALLKALQDEPKDERLE